MTRILLLGHTGKLGTAIQRRLDSAYEIRGLNSKSLDARDLVGAEQIIREMRPDIVVNTIAFMGIEACERHPSETFQVNALFPRMLAQLGAQAGFTLIHFSTETVFSGKLGRPLTEADEPDPVNQYGFSKYLSEVLVQEVLGHHYIFRLPVLFGDGPRRNQFVERMIDRARAGETEFRIADDIVTSPTWTADVADTLARVLDERPAYGLYHIANGDQASLFDLFSEVVRLLDLDVRVERASFRDFPGMGAKNTVTPLSMSGLRPLRSWQDALADYCRSGAAG